MSKPLTCHELADQLCHCYYQTGYEAGKKEIYDKIIKTLKNEPMMVEWKETWSKDKIADKITKQAKAWAVSMVEQIGKDIL